MKNLTICRVLLHELLAQVCLITAPLCHAQAIASKAILMIVPYAPGGGDPYARVMLPRMNEVLGQSVIMENRPGANGIIGSREAVRAGPDGHTILFATSSTLVGGVLLMKDANLRTATRY